MQGLYPPNETQALHRSYHRSYQGPCVDITHPLTLAKDVCYNMIVSQALQHAHTYQDGVQSNIQKSV